MYVCGLTVMSLDITCIGLIQEKDDIDNLLCILQGNEDGRNKF